MKIINLIINLNINAGIFIKDNSCFGLIKQYLFITTSTKGKKAIEVILSKLNEELGKFEPTELFNIEEQIRPR